MQCNATFMKLQAQRNINRAISILFVTRSFPDSNGQQYLLSKTVFTQKYKSVSFYHIMYGVFRYYIGPN